MHMHEHNPMKKVIVAKDPPKFVLAFMFVIFALMIWIATVQFLKNDNAHKETLTSEEMLSCVVELCSITNVSCQEINSTILRRNTADLSSFRLTQNGEVIDGTLGVSNDNGSPRSLMVAAAELRGRGYVTYTTPYGKRIAYVIWEPDTSSIIGASMMGSMF
jgi:hypothetical protein